MAEFRHRKTGEVKTKEEWKKHFKNMSTPSVWNQNVFDSMSIDPILKSPQAKTSKYQISVRDGVEQDAKGNWVEKYVAKNMFSATKDADGKTISKKKQEENYQKKLDDEAAANVRARRNQLLAETDWVVIRAKELGQDVPREFFDYRAELRTMPEQAGFPYNDFPKKPS
tara:strand:- start:160 stop:666 length:507 start_codon:yes stop_codon:yes gene_type:complete